MQTESNQCFMKVAYHFKQASNVQQTVLSSLFYFEKNVPPLNWYGGIGLQGKVI